MNEQTGSTEQAQSFEVRQSPTIRMHLWLEIGEGIFFGLGRAQLLQKIEEHGSLKKAAGELGMSYRAAWGKIKKTEEVIGTRLIVRSTNKRNGYQLSELGKYLTSRYMVWFDAMEKEALRRAENIFPWPVKSYEEEP